MSALTRQLELCRAGLAPAWYHARFGRVSKHNEGRSLSLDDSRSTAGVISSITSIEKESCG